MSLPRQIIPGSTYLITRRCSQRQFLLLPSSIVEQIFLYCLAIAAERTGVLIHAFTLMSNHYHLVATDPFGRVPEFYGWLHALVARALNAHYGRSENFWSSSPTSCVRLLDSDTILEKIVYTAANPVNAGLVSHGDEWPGVRIFTPGRRVIKRPSFFRVDGPLPEEATLNVVAPPLGTASDAVVTLERVVAAVDLRESQIRAEFNARGRSFLGADRVQEQRVTDSAWSEEPRRHLSPRISCSDKSRSREVLELSKQFVADYRRAHRRWSHAARDVLFPTGTYQMVRRYAVAVAPA
jgi:putative transposase